MDIGEPLVFTRPSAEELNAALERGKSIIVATYTHATRYTAKHPADLNAAYAAACARATDTAYRFAVALEECFAPTDSPRTWDAVGRLDFAAERLGELRQLIGIQEPPPRGAQPEED